MNYKVAMIVRSTFYQVPGGDTTQVIQTSAALARLGVCADIILAHTVPDYRQYQLLHFFNICRPAEIIRHINRSKCPFVVSPVFVDYSEYDQLHRGGFSGKILNRLDRNAIEYCKTLGRWLTGTDRLHSISYLWQGQYKSVKNVLQRTSMILPNSVSERDRLVTAYGVEGKLSIIPNGIDPGLFQADSSISKDPDLIVCAGRIEGIKNQLNLVKALNNTRFRLLIIGNPAPNQLAYYNKCREIAASNISFLGQVSQEELKKYYAKAAVHVLPSWFETTGLSSLEAGAMGCKLVISRKGDTYDYFGDAVEYCDPASPDSIFAAVQSAAGSRGDEGLSQAIRQNYTWERAATETFKAYQSILAN